MKTFLPLTLSAALAIGVGAPAWAYKAYNRATVNPVASGGFEVIEGIGSGARSFWCGAADYAMKELNAPGTARLYVQRARGPSITVPGRKSVVFGLDPAGAAPRATLVLAASIRNPGSNLSVDHAFQFCYDSRIINSR